MSLIPLIAAPAGSIATSATAVIEVTACGPPTITAPPPSCATMQVPGFSGAKLFLLQTGICPLDQGRQRAGMQHLCARVSQFGGLAISDLVQHPRIRDQSRIAGHDAIDVGPDPQLLCIHRCRQDGCREIRAATSQGGRTSVDGRSIEAP